MTSTGVPASSARPTPENREQNMPKSNTRKYHGYSITPLVCRGLYNVSNPRGMHVVTAITSSHAHRLIDVLEAANPKPLTSRTQES